MNDKQHRTEKTKVEEKDARKRILIIAQTISQSYLDILIDSLPPGTHIDIITGDEVSIPMGTIHKDYKYDSTSFHGRLKSWTRHYYVVKDFFRQYKDVKYDLIFAISNPPINSYLGLKAKKKFNCPFIYMNWDVYPQVISLTIDNPIAKIVCFFWNQWNKHHYNKIDQMITIGETVAKSIRESIKPFDVKMIVIPLSADTERFKPIEKNSNKFVIEHGLQDEFIVLYSGKMGIGHNIEIILDAANKLKNDPYIHFLLIGGGEKYPIVKEYKEKYNLSNMTVLPFQDEETFPFSMASGDVCIVSQESKVAHLMVPSKVYTMMACGGAIIGICTGNDDLSKNIIDNNIGDIVIDNDSYTLVKKIRELYTNPNKLQYYKDNSRNVCVEKYSRLAVCKELEKLFDSFLYT